MTKKMRIALVMLAIAVMALGTKIFINSSDNDKQDNTKTAKVIEQKHFEYEYYEYDYPTDLRIEQNGIMHSIWANTENANGLVIITMTNQPSIDDKIKIRNGMLDEFKGKMNINKYTTESVEQWGKYKGQGTKITDKNNNTIICFTTTTEPCILIIEPKINPNTEYDRQALQIVKDSFNIK